MDKTEYLLIRNKQVHQMSRDQKVIDKLKLKNLSTEGMLEVGILTGKIIASQNLLDILDEQFDLAYQDDFKIISLEDTTHGN